MVWCLTLVIVSLIISQEADCGEEVWSGICGGPVWAGPHRQTTAWSLPEEKWGREKAGESKRRINGDEKKHDFGWWTRNTIYRWCSIELYTLNLYNFINQCNVNKVNKTKRKLILCKGVNDKTFHYICLTNNGQLVYQSHWLEYWFLLLNCSHSFTYDALYKFLISPFFEIKILF